MRRPEQALHLAAAQYLRLALRPPTIWTAFPAGGGGRVRGAILKGAGLHPGWPDLIVMHPHPVDGTIVVGLEIKAPKGRLSADQYTMAAAFGDAGASYRDCRSIEDVERVLFSYGIPLFARVGANGSIWRAAA